MMHNAHTMTALYSVSVRLRRTTSEAVHISVPITPDLMTAEGMVDAEKLMEAAVALAKDSPLRWASESEPLIEVHPIQTPPA